MGERAVTGELGWELRALSLAYAEAADRRDVAGFLGVFAPDGVVEVHRADRGDRPTGVFRGHDELARIPASLARWASTRHLVGDATYRWEGDDEASGDVACEAHHVRPADRSAGGDTGGDLAGGDTDRGSVDEVMMITYHDRYRLVDGRWLIAHRRADVASIRTEAAADGTTP